jgi:hypothetical protein
MVHVLRQDPVYLTRLAKLLPYQKLDDVVHLIAHSLHSDLFLVSEDILLLKLIKVQLLVVYLNITVLNR